METTDEINALRSLNREELQTLRKESRSTLLKHRRLKLCEVENYIKDVTLEEFRELLMKFKHKNPSVQVIHKIKNVCVKSEYITAFFKFDGAFDSLIRAVIGNDGQKQLEALACLTNLACGSHKFSFRIAKKAGAYLVSFINGNNHFLQDQSAWAVGNIANDCMDCFHILKNQGILPALLKGLKSPISSVVQSVVFALNVCTKYEDSDIVVITKPDLLESLLTLIESNYEPTSIDAAFILVNYCYIAAIQNLEAINIRTVEIVLNCLDKTLENSKFQVAMATPLVRCLGYLTCKDTICKFLCQHTTFYRLALQLLNVEYSHLKKETLWVLSNVLVSEDLNINCLQIVPLLTYIKEVLKPENPDVLQVLYFLSLLISRNDMFYILLKQHGILFYIDHFTHCGDKDVKKAAEMFFQKISIS